MGYSIAIGQLEVIRHEDEDFEDGFCISYDAESVTNPDAPAFGEPTDYTNSRWPSYTAWSKTVKFLGIYELMFDEENGLMKNHPGYTALTQEHKAIIDAAYVSFYEKYPNAKPGYSPKSRDGNDLFIEDPDWPEANGIAVRLEWLKYWIDWALANCSEPVFCNS
jgi:hypothetical protein